MSSLTIFTKLDDGRYLKDAFEEKLNEMYQGRVPMPSDDILILIVEGPGAYVLSTSTEPPRSPVEVPHYNEYSRVLKEVLPKSQKPKGGKFPTTEEFHKGLKSVTGSITSNEQVKQSIESGKPLTITRPSAYGGDLKLHNPKEAMAKLGDFELLVLLALDSLYMANDEGFNSRYFSVRQIAEVIGAVQPGKRMGANQEERIIDALELMATMRITIDGTKRGKNEVFRGYLCPVEMRSGVVNGHYTKTTVRQYERSPVFDHAEWARQISYVPLEALSLPKNMRAQGINIALHRYMLKYLVMKNNAHVSKYTFYWDTLYDELKIDRRDKSRVRDAARKLAEHYCENLDFVSGKKEKASGITLLFKT